MSVMVSGVVALVLGQSSTVRIQDLVQPALRDASWRARVERSAQRELQKINRDFANSYRFSFTDVQMKEPFMLRLESTVDDQSILYILNGPIRMFRIPRAGINRRENLARAPGKRQTPLDFGLLTPSLFDNFFTARFVRNDRATGNVVFDVTYVPSLGDTTRHRIWVDRTRRIVTKREWYSQNGGFLVATFYYEEPRSFSGIWIPTRLRVHNADDKFAGSTRYENIRVNTGLSDSIFRVN